MNKEKKTKTIQVRLTESDYAFLYSACEKVGTNPSQLIRQLVQMTINTAKTAEANKLGKEVVINENS